MGSDIPDLTVQAAALLAFAVATWLLLFGIIYTNEITGLLGRIAVNLQQRSGIRHAFSPASAQGLGARSHQGQREQLADSVRELLDLISRHLSGSEEYSLMLNQADEQLRGKPNIAQLKLIIEHVISHNGKMREESAKLSSELASLRSRTQLLNDQLTKVRILANLDDLTGLPNRRATMRRLEEAVAASHSQGNPLALVIADIDKFKTINDEHGHPAGDSVLKSFAQIISSSVRNSDFVGRFGGEEFLLILPKATAGTALSIIECIQNRLREHRFSMGPNARPIDAVTASYGIALVRDGELAADLIARADRKLYDAKKNGRNRAEIDSRFQA